MARALRRTSAPGGPWYEFVGTCCPICGNNGMCMIHEDEEKVVCCRVESKIAWAKNSALPGWLHFLNEDQRKFDIKRIEAVSDNPKRETSELNRAYTALISELNLTPAHMKHLTGPERKLTINQILARKYRSFPEKPWQVASKVIERIGGEDLVGVPGFYLKDGKDGGNYTTMKGFKNSFLIPFRNQRNEIVGFQYRVDEVKYQCFTKAIDPTFKAFIKTQPNEVVVQVGGKTVFQGKLDAGKWYNFSGEGDKVIGQLKIKKGTRYIWLSSANEEGGTGAGPLPVHVAVPYTQLKDWKTGTTLQKKCVWLTEGPIKADISSDLLGTLFGEELIKDYGNTILSIPGVNSWRIILPILKEMGVERVILAIDMDAVTNKDVKMHMMECSKELVELNYQVDIAMWDVNIAKGIDDLLLQNQVPQIRTLGKRQ